MVVVMWFTHYPLSFEWVKIELFVSYFYSQVFPIITYYKVQVFIELHYWLDLLISIVHGLKL